MDAIGDPRPDTEQAVQSTLVAAALQPRSDITARPVPLGLGAVLRMLKAGHADVVVVVGSDFARSVGR
jgi:hypothetical protein